MRSGISFDNDVFSVEMWVDEPANPLRYIYAEPGERFYYRDADPQVLGYLLQRETRRREESLAKERLFSPLGIERYWWESGPDGVSMAAHGLHLKARDLAKIGQLMLDEGTFAGQRVVSTEWCRTMTTVHVPSGSEGTRHDTLGYGYYVWIAPEQGVYSAWGHGGQFVLVDPRQRLVVVKIALPDTDDLHGATLEEFLGLMSPLLSR